MTRAVLAAGVALAFAATVGHAQTLAATTPDFARLADGKGALVFNRALTVATDRGRTVARLDARAGDGGVILEGIQLGEGVIEVDLKGKDVAQQSFLGIAFHVVDWTTLDAVYFRPFNFRAGAAEQRSHAVQYVSHPANTWQRLRAERPGQFEQAIDPPPDPNAWFQARIVLAGGRVEVFVNGASKPSLSVEDLGSAKSGGVALWVGNGSDGAFANLRITPTAPAGPPPASTQNIFQASSTGNLARVRALVEADARLLGARNPNGFTPLHAAALYGQRETAEFLAAKGADLNAVARHSGTPLDVAYEAGQTKFVAWLEPRGARFTPIRFDVAQVAPSIRRVAFPWGMMNNVVVFSGADGAVVIDTGFSTRAIPGFEEAHRRVVGARHQVRHQHARARRSRGRERDRTVAPGHHLRRGAHCRPARPADHEGRRRAQGAVGTNAPGALHAPDRRGRDQAHPKARPPLRRGPNRLLPGREGRGDGRPPAVRERSRGAGHRRLPRVPRRRARRVSRETPRSSAATGATSTRRVCAPTATR